MKYEIRRLALGCRAALSLNEDEFAEILDAKNALFCLFDIELDYDILLGNWLQLESTVHALTFERFARPLWKRTEADRNHSELNRHIANLLSSARGFIDHTQHHLASLPGSTQDDRTKIETLFSAQYDASLSYRVGEAVRNYAQHSGLPTQGLSTSMRWIGDVGDGKLAASMSPYLIVEKLRSDPKFKKTVAEELEAAKLKDVPIMPLLREYVEGLSAIASQVRVFYKDKMETWLSTFEKWPGRYCETASEEGNIGVAAIRKDEDGKIIEEIHFGVEIQERLAELQRVNRAPLTNLRRLQITS